MRRLVFAFLLVLGAPVFAAEPQAGKDAPAVAEEDSPAAAVDKLYARLAKTPFSDEAAGLIQEIESTRMQSGSDAADLLMSRAEQARASDPPLALQLLDALVALYPDWSRGWNERATLRFQSGDNPGAMADIAQTLKREPRDIGALAGLGAILTDSGQPEGALEVYDRALALAPAYEPLKEARVRAQTAVWGRSP